MVISKYVQDTLPPVTKNIYAKENALTLYIAVTQFTIGKLRYCYVKS